MSGEDGGKEWRRKKSVRWNGVVCMMKRVSLDEVRRNEKRASEAGGEEMMCLEEGRIIIYGLGSTRGRGGGVTATIFIHMWLHHGAVKPMELHSQLHMFTLSLKRN